MIPKGTVPRDANCFQGVDAGISFQNAARQGRRARAYMDVFTAILKRNTRIRTLYGNYLKGRTHLETVHF